MGGTQLQTGVYRAGMYVEDNTNATVIEDTGGDFVAYHNSGLAGIQLTGFTFNPGGAGTSFPIASIADAGSGDILVTTTGAHGLKIGDIISQSNLADSAYASIFVVKTVPTSTTYTVAAVFTATGTGTMDQAATLNVEDFAVGDYLVTWFASVSPQFANRSIDFGLNKNAGHIIGSRVRQELGGADDFSSVSGRAFVSLEIGDKISFELANLDTGDDVTIRNFILIVLKLRN